MHQVILLIFMFLNIINILNLTGFAIAKTVRFSNTERMGLLVFANSFSRSITAKNGHKLSIQQLNIHYIFILTAVKMTFFKIF